MTVPEAVWNEIDALKQAHAELAAKVAKLETRVDVHKAGIEWCHEHVKGSELSEDAPNVVEQAYYAHRVFPTGLLAQEYARVTRIGPDDVDYVPALESPAPAPDPVCARCNGTGIRSWHPEPGITEQTECDECDTVMDGLPTAEPEPAPLDPVLVAIRDLYVLVTTEPKAALALDSLSCELRQRWRKITRAGTREYEVDSAIRSYGRDGAR